MDKQESENVDAAFIFIHEQIDVFSNETFLIHNYMPYHL